MKGREEEEEKLLKNVIQHEIDKKTREEKQGIEENEKVRVDDGWKRGRGEREIIE